MAVIHINRLTPSDLPFSDLSREKRQLSTDHGLMSSLDESNMEEINNESNPNSRGKRFFFPYTYTTITSYSFVSTTITKAVNLASSPAAAGAGALLCRPAGYVIC